MSNNYKTSLCNVSCDIFKKPNIYSSYILGLLWGDGYLYECKRYRRISIESIESDLSEVQNIFIKTGKWTVNKRIRKNRKPQMSFSTSNKELYEYLSKYNYINKSELNSTIINYLSKDLLPYWWRGYFDADGCFYTHYKNKTHQLHFSSSYNQDWTFAENLFKELNCSYYIVRREQLKNGKINKSSKIQTSKKLDCKKILDYIYCGEIFGFSRKYNHYIEFINLFYS